MYQTGGCGDKIDSLNNQLQFLFCLYQFKEEILAALEKEFDAIKLQIPENNRIVELAQALQI